MQELKFMQKQILLQKMVPDDQIAFIVCQIKQEINTFPFLSL